MKKILTTITISALVGTSASNLKPVFTNNIVSHDFKSNIKLRVTNGTDVPEGKYPWFATFKAENIKEIGGGCNLVSPSWLLTAAHVVQNASKEDKIKLVFGLYDKINYDKNKLIVRTIKNIIIFGNNPGDTKNFDLKNDIALVQLDKPIHDIPPISLYSKKEKPIASTIATVMGWGVNGSEKNGKWTMPTHLQQANIPILDDSVSKDSRWTFPYWDSKTEILAGVITGDKRINAAVGDSGGPLIIKDNDKDVLVGIVSHSPVEDDKFIDPEPGIFTFVGTFYDWIKENTNNFS